MRVLGCFICFGEVGPIFWPIKMSHHGFSRTFKHEPQTPGAHPGHHIHALTFSDD